LPGFSSPSKPDLELLTLAPLRRGSFYAVAPIEVRRGAPWSLLHEGGQAIIGNVRSGTTGKEHPSSRMSNEIDDDRNE
jgi:hypothetical protein